MNIPETSTTLLSDIARDSQHARWGEFVARYRPMMASYMLANFPHLDADDIIQETLIALIRVLPVYHYVPNEKGSFHNYLTGILRHKALKFLARESQREALHVSFAQEPNTTETTDESADQRWREAVFEIALQQYLADDTVHALTKQVFTRLAVNGEKPEDVARAFGIARNAVDQIKNRAMARLRLFVKALEQVDDARLEH